MRPLFCFIWIIVSVLGAFKSHAFQSRDTIYPIFQFPQHKMVSIDGEFSDWDLVPETYAIGLDQMKETINGIGFNLDSMDLDVTVKVAWVKDLNRLYFHQTHHAHTRSVCFRATNLSEHTGCYYRHHHSLLVLNVRY